MYTVFNIGLIAALFACAFANYPLQSKMFSRLSWLYNVCICIQHLHKGGSAEKIILCLPNNPDLSFKSANGVQRSWNGCTTSTQSPKQHQCPPQSPMCPLQQPWSWFQPRFNALQHGRWSMSATWWLNITHIIAQHSPLLTKMLRAFSVELGWALFYHVQATCNGFLCPP